MVTVRGQKAASPPSGLSTVDSPALWPRTPGKGDSRPSSKTPGSAAKQKKGSCEVQPQTSPSLASSTSPSHPHSNESDPEIVNANASSHDVIACSHGHSSDSDLTVASPCTRMTATMRRVSLRSKPSPSPRDQAALPLSASPPLVSDPSMVIATHGETSAEVSRSSLLYHAFPPLECYPLQFLLLMFKVKRTSCTCILISLLFSMSAFLFSCPEDAFMIFSLSGEDADRNAEKTHSKDEKAKHVFKLLLIVSHWSDHQTTEEKAPGKLFFCAIRP